ncbi:MAG: hypothetical protein MJZ37_06400 [Bacilli bacterium]|nr:hypothetical protein [Bacilli bacterium]
MKYKVTYTNIVGFDSLLIKYKYFETPGEVLEFMNNYFIMVSRIEEV